MDNVELSCSFTQERDLKQLENLTKFCNSRLNYLNFESQILSYFSKLSSAVIFSDGA